MEWRTPVWRRRQRRCVAWCVSWIQSRNQDFAGQLEGGPRQSRKGTTLHSPSNTQRVLTRTEQKFCCEVVLWKQFKHPNLLPLVGARKASHSLIMVSEWMEHGTIMDFIIAHPETNRLRLVSIFHEAESEPCRRLSLSWQTSLVD